MTDTNEPDDELLAELRDAVLSSDRPPERLRDAAIRALTWDTDIETLLITFDSAKESAGMRSATATRDITFSRDGVEVEVSIFEDDGEIIVSGVIGGDITQATLARPRTEDHPLETDEHGRFRLAVTGTLAEIIVTTADSTQIRTGLFSLDPSMTE